MSSDRRQASSPVRFCVGASAGGHTSQLLSLLENDGGWPISPTVCVTTLDILRSQFEKIGPTTVIGECNRKQPVAAVAVFIRALRFVLAERPDVLVTTGAMPLALVAIWVKVFGGAVVWIDSVARIRSMSLSGRLVRRFADLTLVQWPHLADETEGIEYVGQLL